MTEVHAAPGRARPDTPRRTRRASRGPWFTVVLAALFAAIAAAGSYGLGDRLSLGGYVADNAEAGAADAWLDAHFGAGEPQLVLLARVGGGTVDAPAAAAEVRRIAAGLAAAGDVTAVRAYWNSPGEGLRSPDGKLALITVRLRGDDTRATYASERLVREFAGRHGPLTLDAAGPGPTRTEIVAQTRRDVERAEFLGGPLTLLILVAALGSLVAGLLPVAVGGAAVAGALLVLRVYAAFAPVSILTMNLTTSLGFGLAVDYCLLIVSRYREECVPGRAREEAVAAAVRTAGRAVVFSALTVASCAAALLLVPLYFLSSMAVAIIAVTLLAALCAVVLLPALLLVTGGVLDRFDPFAPLRRRLGSPWHRVAHAVMRRPLLWLAVVGVLLGALAAPAFGARMTISDERVLAPDSPVQNASQRADAAFGAHVLRPIRLVLPGEAGRGAARYLADVSELPGVVSVTGPTGVLVHGRVVDGDAAAVRRHTGPGGAYAEVVTAGAYDSEQVQELVGTLRAERPDPRVMVGGLAASVADTKEAITSRLPWVLAAVALCLAFFLFVFTGSVLVPLKALAMSALSLAATLGFLVWVFQDGHLRSVLGGFTVDGRLEISTPVLAGVIVFVLTVDYEVFLLSRVQEEYRASGDMCAAVAHGLSRTGGLLTTAALVLSALMAMMAASRVEVTKLFGVGVAFALVLDAVVIRALLVPAVMKLAGRLNWWAPHALSRAHARLDARARAAVPPYLTK
ncbi:MMPL family transporter [Streptomyces sp. NPDC020983]|uniref:MMPL family transporter n=1 Tax=Streptomyces sp. NPDC020983 TaxID=3365106 RepID=UPI0037B2D60A